MEGAAEGDRPLQRTGVEEVSSSSLLVSVHVFDA